MAEILIIDDDRAVCGLLGKMVDQMGHHAMCAYTREEGVRLASQFDFDVVFLDVNLPDGNGLDLLSQIRQRPTQPEVIIMTGFGNPDGAEIAIRNGAWDYVQKADDPREFMLALKRVIQYREGTTRQLTQETVALDLEGIVGRSKAIRECHDLLAQAANSTENVLIVGETGTGKELFARAIHRNGPRKKRPFVVVDCAALPETLVESVLFGHVKGAFTGAVADKRGLVSHAHGGTLFLDEIGELPLQLQRVLLRVLQEHCFRRVGAHAEENSDFRLICATNRDLKSMVESGGFRQDLLFRIQTLLLNLPPLRDREGDVVDLAVHYTSYFCAHYELGLKGFSPDFIEALSEYHWPGNVREMMNVIERAISKARKAPTLFPVHLPVPVRADLARSNMTANEPPALEPPPNNEHIPIDQPLKAVLVDVECRYLEKLLDHIGPNITEACERSGLSRSRLYDRLKKYGIKPTSI